MMMVIVHTGGKPWGGQISTALDVVVPCLACVWLAVEKLSVNMTDIVTNLCKHVIGGCTLGTMYSHSCYTINHFALPYWPCPKSSVPVASAARKPSPSVEPANQVVMLIHQHDWSMKRKTGWVRVTPSLHRILPIKMIQSQTQVQCRTRVFIPWNIVDYDVLIDIFLSYCRCWISTRNHCEDGCYSCGLVTPKSPSKPIFSQCTS